MCGRRLVVIVGLLVGTLATPGVGPALGAGRADLVVRALSATPATVAPGAQLRVTATVANGGSARARGSSVAFLLSHDRRRDRRDIALRAHTKVKALARHGSARAKATLRVPVKAAPGRWYVLACADAGRAVREIREANNCTSSRRAVTVGAPPSDVVAPKPVGGAPAPGPSSAGPAPDLPGFVPAPLDVAPQLDAGRAASKSIGADGGTLTAAGADGTTYTLTLPKDAVLDPETITMTPIAGIGGLPFSGGLGGGVQIEPDGLRLTALAKLVITPPAPVPFDQRAAFSYLGAGKDLHLYPTTFAPGSIEYQLVHFSAYGWGKATDADRAAQAQRVPSSREAWAQQNAARAIQEAHAAELRGDSSRSAQWVAAEQVALYVWGNEGVRPQLTGALTDDAAFEHASTEYVSWARTVDLLGAKDATLEGLSDELDALFLAARDHAQAAAETRCHDNNDPYQYKRMLAFERESQLVGFPPDPQLYDRLDRCYQFELHAKVTFTFAYDDTDPFSTGTDKATLVIPIHPMEEGFQAIGEPELTDATVTSTDPDHVFWSWKGTATVSRPAEVPSLKIDFGTPSASGEVPKPKVELSLNWGMLFEDGTGTGCSDGAGCQTHDAPSSIWGGATGALYLGGGTSPGATVFQDWDLQEGAGNPIFATKDRNRSLHSATMQGTGIEDVHLELVHTPA